MATYFTLGQASKEVGKSKGTLSNMIRSGKLSIAEKTEKGHYRIEASELFRVFPPQPSTTVSNIQPIPPIQPAENGVLLQQEIKLLREQLDAKREENEKLWSQLEKSQSIIERQTLLLLPDKTEKPSESPQTRNKSLLAMLVAKKPR